MITNNGAVPFVRTAIRDWSVLGANCAIGSHREFQYREYGLRMGHRRDQIRDKKDLT